MIVHGYNVKILEDIPNMIKDLELVNEKMIIKAIFPYGLEKFKRNDYIQDSSIITDYIGLPRSIKELDRFESD
jgi:methyl coenzyme M reductase subunit D